ncbi:MAG: co-chaperone GroES [Parachlamydiaceae bacterium]
MAQTQTEKKSKSAASAVNFHPLGNRVLVKRLEPEEKLKGGIILPDTAKKKQEQAVVVAVGKGAYDKDGKLIPCPVNVGDTILMEKYASQEIILNDEEYVIVRGDDIIAVIEK